jgi:hypothetical protein
LLLLQVYKAYIRLIKNLKRKISKFILAAFLLLCFTMGQVIIFTHNHAAYLKTAQGRHNKTPNPDEACKICHLNHTTTALLYADDQVCSFYGIIYKQLQVESLAYYSIALILSDNRGPPVA